MIWMGRNTKAVNGAWMVTRTDRLCGYRLVTHGYRPVPSRWGVVCQVFFSIRTSLFHPAAPSSSAAAVSMLSAFGEHEESVQCTGQAPKGSPVNSEHSDPKSSSISC